MAQSVEWDASGEPGEWANQGLSASTRAAIDSWMADATSFDGEADGQANNSRGWADGSGRGHTPMRHHAVSLPVSETSRVVTGALAWPDQRETPAYCYRLIETGGVVVSPGHPTACACSRNGRLYAGQSIYLAAWPDYFMLSPPSRYLTERQRCLNIAMRVCADTLYPLDKLGAMSYNPYRLPERCDALFTTPSVSESVLAIGAAIDFLNRGKSASSLVNMNLANAGCMINEALRSREPSQQTLDEKQSILQAILCLVTVSFCVGDLAAWRTRMRNLRRYLEVSSLLNAVEVHFTTRIRGTDIEGAILAGQAPSIDCVRRHQLLPCVLSVRDVEAILDILRPQLRACNVSQEVIDTMIATSLFMRTMRAARERTIDEKFDPENLMEDYDFLQRDLLSVPMPLQVHNTPSHRSEERVESYASVPNAATGNSTQDPSEAFEEALRVTTLMCLRAGTMEGPWSKISYAALLAHQVSRLHIILDWICKPRVGTPFVDPTLLVGSDDRELPVINARPFLVWMCMIGYQLSTYYAIFHEGWTDHRRENCVYLRLLKALGVHNNADIDTCKEADLMIFDTLNTEWATARKWDAKDMLRWIIG